MTIFESNKVDIVMTVNEGPRLMIVDPGTEPDVKKWIALLEEKLKHYVHVIRCQFAGKSGQSFAG